MIKSLYSLTLSALLLLAAHNGFSQSQIPIFNWRSHISYNQVLDVAAANDFIYAASPNGLFFVDLTENSINRLTKSNGLSDVSIGAIGFDITTKTLVIGYTNGNIDLLSGNSIQNIRTVLDAPTTTNKSFNDVAFNEGKAYLSGDLGIVVIDLNSQEIVESYQNIGVNGQRTSISELVFFQNRIYAASQDGILSASLNSEVNRQDFNNWTRAFVGISFSNIQQAGNSLFASADMDLFVFDGTNWAYETSANSAITDIVNEADVPVLLTSEGIYAYTNQINQLYRFAAQGIRKSELVRHQNAWWVGDGFDGLLKVANNAEQAFKPSGPVSDEVWHLGKGGEETLKISGGFDENLNALDHAPFLSSFSFASGWTNQVLISNSDSIKDIVDFESVSFGGKDRLALASFSDGLYFLTDDELTFVNELSPNTTLDLGFGNFRMTGLAKYENSLWVSNYGGANPLHEWNFAENTWRAYQLSNSRASFATDMFIAPNGDKWLAVDDTRGGGIVVYNEVTNTERYLNTNGGQGGLPGSKVNAMVLDQNQFLWVGTDEGVAFFPNLSVILQGQSLSASIPVFENRLLLRDENITAMAVDPANRKWFGTKNNGLWLFSETGEQQVQRFTTDNSPLISNTITSIYVEEISGEVFIGTDKGLVSFKSDATLGTSEHSDVKIYPNPVPPNFNGEIVVNGLVNNALAKITDIGGKLINEVRANGSTAIWNGRDYNGVRVQTGVYLVFSSNSDGTETFVGKIVII